MPEPNPNETLRLSALRGEDLAQAYLTSYFEFVRKLNDLAQDQEAFVRALQKGTFTGAPTTRR